MKFSFHITLSVSRSRVAFQVRERECVAPQLLASLLQVALRPVARELSVGSRAPTRAVSSHGHPIATAFSELNVSTHFVF